jgi:hypothetical protein
MERGNNPMTTTTQQPPASTQKPAAKPPPIVLSAKPKPTHDELKRPIVRISPNDAPPHVKTAENALMTSGLPIFVRGNRVVWLGSKKDLPQARQETIRRSDDAPIVLPATQSWMKMTLYDLIACRTMVGKTCHAPDSLVQLLLDRASQAPYPPLMGILTAPTLRADGTVLQAPGYDPASGMYLKLCGTFPQVSQHPSKDDAVKALEFLAGPFRRFPWQWRTIKANNADKAVVLAALLTMVSRVAMRTVPMFGLSANLPGSGKSLLSESIGLFGTGCLPSFIPGMSTDETFQKQLESVLLAADQLVVLDNWDRPLHSTLLCSMLTNPYSATVRRFHAQENVPCPFVGTVLATGNNLSFKGDLCRRALLCYLDADVEHPEDRRMDFDPRIEIQQNRPALIAAALTVLRAYIAADRPDQKLRPFGSFEDFDLIRGTLCWLGYDDPCETRKRIISTDDTREAFINLLRVWIEQFGESEVKASELLNYHELSSALRDAMNVRPQDNMPSSVRIGKWLGSRKNQIAAGLKLVEGGDENHCGKWKVTGIHEQLKIGSVGNKQLELPHAI